MSDNLRILLESVYTAAWILADSIPECSKGFVYS